MVEKLSVVQAWELVQMNESMIVDLRDPSEFANGHAQGALNLPYSEKGLEDRLSVLLQPGSPVILFVESPCQAEGAVLQLHGGTFPLLGVLETRMKEWHDGGFPMENLIEVPVQHLVGTAFGKDKVIVDVREPIEWEMGHIPGALLISLGALRKRLHELPRGVGIILICEAGVRSSSAASILQAEGFAEVAHVPEGTAGYRRAGLPLQFLKEHNYDGKVS